MMVIERLLLRLTKITRVDSRFILHGGFWMLIDQITTTVTSLASALIFAYILSKDNYGTYKYILSIVSIITITTLPGLNGPTAHAVAEGNEGSFKLSLFTKIKWGFLGAAILLGVAAYYYFAKHNIYIASSCAVAAIFLPFMDSLNLYASYLQAKNHYKESVIYYIISQLTATACVISAAWFTKNAVVIIFAYFFSWTLMRFYFLHLTMKKFPPNTIVSEKTIKYGFHLNAINAVGQIAGYLDSLLLFNYVGPVAVAIYSVCTSPTEQIKSLIKDIPQLTMPKLVKKSAREINQKIPYQIFLFICIGIVISVGLVLILPYIFPIVFPKYASNVFYAQLYAPTLALRTPMAIFSSILQAKLTHLKKSWLAFNAIPNVILIITLLIFTPLYGIVGIIACRYLNIITAGTVSIIQWYLLSKKEALDDV